MCVRINKDFINGRDLLQIRGDCFVEGKENDYGPTEKLRAYGETSSSLYIPFSYAKTRFDQHPNTEISFPKTNYKFHTDKFPFRTDGGRDQQVVFNEASAILRKERSVLLSLHCGYGKCLAKDTPVLMYTGDIKKVQDVVLDDLLMGDDSQPRKVLSLARGQEKMYKVNSKGESYTVNESHVLSLKVGGDIIDITVKDYLARSDRKWFFGYRVGVDFPEQPITIDPFELGERLGDNGNVSGLSIPQSYKINSREVRKQLLLGLRHSICAVWKKLPEKLWQDVVYIARSLGFRVDTKAKTLDMIENSSLEYPIIVIPVGVGDYYGFTIDGNRRFLLGDFTVTHNTYEAIRLAQSSHLKCAVLAHRGVLFDQWVDSIAKFTTATVQQVDTDGVLDPNADFYIFNIGFVYKRWDKSKQGWVPKKLGIYKDTIGILIVDEAHIACASEMSRALLYFNPRYAIALTATPVRKDGMDKVLELYFGKYDTTRIIRIATDPFIVYRLPTGIKPVFTRNAFGKKDWNSVINALIESEERNKLIIRLVSKFDVYNILILTKRKDHCKFLAKELTKLKISNTVMVGTSKKYDKTARVLLSTYSKLGVGFDDVRLNMLIVACSVTEVEQYAGRLRDGHGKKRVIIDLVDSDPNCLKHWQERRQWYISRNGTVKNYYKEYPEEKKDMVAEASMGQEEENDTLQKEKPKRLARRLHE